MIFKCVSDEDMTSQNLQYRYHDTRTSYLMAHHLVQTFKKISTQHVPLDVV
jgi:hypothetical protein